MTLPNFLILGAQKAGSTWLVDNLRQHPEVFLPGRELHFFDKDYNYAKGIEWYKRHFARAGGKKAVGEKTADYLWANGLGVEGHMPRVHRNIHGALSDTRLIAVLRNPVERAISAVNHIVRTGRVSPFIHIDDLLLGDQRYLVEGHGVIDCGRYHRQIAAYLELFDRSRLLLLVFEEDVVADPASGLRKVCEFLEIDPSFGFPYRDMKRNEYRASRFALALSYYVPFAKYVAKYVDPFEPHKQRPGDETLSGLYALYKTENEKLFDLLGHSVASWQR